ncbi:MAG: hypothetical protein HYU44_03460 [Betaproteobacteria bacterium]|nr:hypothetical protein [Betaproteobacteria bacterium]MBI2290266.1 hypothetical protein [Betaproteobacteria bacterium]MBI3055647.1 hypothetical protein [Betaproteobacteria bacterium]
MNAPEKNLRICVAPGVYVLRAAPAKTRASARHAALMLLTAMRRAKRGRAVGSGRVYLKEVRAARHGR